MQTEIPLAVKTAPPPGRRTPLKITSELIAAVWPMANWFGGSKRDLARAHGIHLRNQDARWPS